MIDRRAVRGLRVIFGLLPLVAIWRQLVEHRELGFGLVNFFSYFTILSNLMAGVVLLWAAGSGARISETARAASVINMTLVGIVFTVLLRNADPGSLLPWVNVVHHYVMPCVVLLDWMEVPPRVALGRRQLLICLVFPFVYLVYVLLRGGMTGWYPYPFLNSNLVGGPGIVAAYVIAITLAFVIAGGGLIALGNRRASISHRRWAGES
jgi:hypothetical protein